MFGITNSMRFITKLRQTILLIGILILGSLETRAQEKSEISSSIMYMYAPWNHIGGFATETTSLGTNHIGYAYAEIRGLSASSPEAYCQLLWEQKFWEKPIFLHAEYRGFGTESFYESSAYLGAAYCIYTKHGYLALEPLLMWKQEMGVGGQFSIVGGWVWKRFMIEHYTDIWKAHKMESPVDFYTQTRLFYKIWSRLSIGVIGTIYNNYPNENSYIAHIALRWKL